MVVNFAVIAESLHTAGLGGRFDHQYAMPKTRDAASTVPAPIDAPHSATRFQLFIGTQYSASHTATSRAQMDVAKKRQGK